MHGNRSSFFIQKINVQNIEIVGQTWTQSASNRENLGGLRRERADGSSNGPMVLSFHLYSRQMRNISKRGGRGVAWMKTPGIIKTANLGGLAIFFSSIQVCMR